MAQQIDLSHLAEVYFYIFSHNFPSETAWGEYAEEKLSASIRPHSFAAICHKLPSDPAKQSAR